MGYGSYSVDNSIARNTTMYSKSTREEIFVEKKLNIAMTPENTIRECADSPDHPNTIPIIIALDVTGSMGAVPDAFIREEMTKMMSSLYSAGLTDSQVLFLGIGDHECDRAPLQVGQFEADDQLLDKWLKSIYLEGGGGGNDGESYLLAWYYAAKHTKIDSFDKRGVKGFVFTIGDEPTLKTLPTRAQQKIFGSNGVYADETVDSLLAEAGKKYNTVHLHLSETRAGSTPSTQNGWKQLMGGGVRILNSYKEIATTIVDVVKGHNTGTVQVSTPVTKVESETEMML
jgi:hypothetical protein